MASTSIVQGIGTLNRLPPQTDQAKHKRQTIKKVSWAPEYSLCQVRLFLAEDAPLQSGLGVQDQLQAKRSWLWHAEGSGFEGDLPPGFGKHSTQQYIQEDCVVTQTTWKCPPRFVMNPAWQVVAGDESQEGKVQCEREVRILEAVYPRPSAIPPSPAEPPEPQDEYNDSDVPLIPLIPIEDDDIVDLDDAHQSCSPCEALKDFGDSGVSSQGSFNNMDNTNEVQLNSTGMLSQGGNLIPAGVCGVDQPSFAPTSIPALPTGPDVAAAAAAAFMAIMRSNEEGSMIDQDLLIKILSNPQIIEALTSQHRKNINTSMNSIPISQPISTKHNGPKFTCDVDHDPSPLTISRPQGACQVAPPVIAGNNKNSLVTSEVASSHLHGPLHLPVTDAKSFGTTVSTVPQMGTMPVGSSALLPSTAGQANLHLVSRPATVPFTTTKAVCQSSKGTSTAAPIVSTVNNQSSFPDEQYYKNLIQKHGLQSNNHQNGFQYYKDLIQQHGAVQIVEKSSSLDPNRSKYRKPCIYFNTPNGCRRGASCTFLHEDSNRSRLDASDMQHPKRAKTEIEAPGRS